MVRRWMERSLVFTWSDGNKVSISNQSGCHQAMVAGDDSPRSKLYGGCQNALNRGRPVWANCDLPVSYSADEIIRRARSRVGENHYRIFSNNCEHFCEWCLRGQHRSYQVEAWLSAPARVLETIIGLMDKIHKYLGAEVISDVEQS
jgi:hypothetical protein